MQTFKGQVDASLTDLNGRVQAIEADVDVLKVVPVPTAAHAPPAAAPAFVLEIQRSIDEMKLEVQRSINEMKLETQRSIDEMKNNIAGAGKQVSDLDKRPQKVEKQDDTIRSPSSS
ncbi:hypothetical protein FA95DRAFT_1565977 [Auriscalpium vulgare]|uniref:Uncharacterized protein n=1 Tax=Auriscalpium vulgare TaxID=40419 RepID=A0ACB8RA66_9AGAM|nr:hypothetical protein FA95DRAFT_1565977 [Auriscalpium vulgare]